MSVSSATATTTTLDAAGPVSATAPVSAANASAETISSAAPSSPADTQLDRLSILPWLDPAQDDDGHDPRSAYVETFWLPVLGPSTTLLLRRLADEFDDKPDGFEIEALELSAEIGLGPRMGRRGAFARTLDRCAKFNMIQVAGPVIYVRRRIPRLGHRQVAKLNERLQVLHHTWTIDPADDGAARRTELVRAAHLARTLLALGESPHDSERQLHQWHFHPSIAWHAVQWAQTDPGTLP